MSSFIHKIAKRIKESFVRFIFWLFLWLTPPVFLIFHDYLFTIFFLSFLILKIIKQPVELINSLCHFLKSVIQESKYIKKYFLFRLARLITFLYSIKRKVNKWGKRKKGVKYEYEVIQQKIQQEKKRKIITEIHAIEKQKSDRERFTISHKKFSFFLRFSKWKVFIFIIVIFLGIFALSIPRLTEYRPEEPIPIEERVEMEEKIEEGKILGEKIIREKPKESLTLKIIIGRLLAGIALFFGAIFFLYSLKYYLISIIVLIASRAVNNQKEKPGIISSFLYRLFFKGNNQNRNKLNNNNSTGSIGFLPDLQNNNNHIKSFPLISVHLPFYNEKKVANRVLTACTSFDYPNYEIIVIDDSTDETVQILEKWKKHPRVRILHREERKGFKGGALREALKIMDDRTEFVVVFDADFIPYPDTLKQFLKYFLANGNGNNNHFLNNNNHNNNQRNSRFSYRDTNIAAVQGYQWHVLNKNENWVTRSVRSEFAGSYVIERPGTELIGSLKQIAGSVYMIRADVLKSYGWTDSITEDFELTLKIYKDGWKVIYTPYIQTPAECVSTIKRLIRQRMRWAEGHTANVKKYFWPLLKSPKMSRREKLEFLYLAPYYLQSVFLLIGTSCWFLSDVILHSQLPFWTDLWGWSLVFVNLIALPFINSIGLFFEESPERDYLGIFSFIALTYIIAPFQALAALKGLFKKEGGWFRTPKSGHITDLYFRSKYRKWFRGLFPKKPKTVKERKEEIRYSKIATANSKFRDFKIEKRKETIKISNIVSIILILTTLALQFFSTRLPNIGKEEFHQESTKFGLLKSPGVQDYSFENGESKLSTITSFDWPVIRKEITTEAGSKIIIPEEDEASPPSVITPGPAPKEGVPDKPPRDLPGPEEEIPEDIPLPEVRPEPGDPIEFREDLPEPVKEAVRIAWLEFPEGVNEIELEDLRTANSKYFLRRDGMIRHEIGAGPLHYYDDKKNGWQDINLEIKSFRNFSTTSLDTYKYANTTNYFKTYFKENSQNNNYVKFSLNNKEISFSLPEYAELGSIQKHEAKIKNNQITYPEIYPGIDLRYTVGLDSLLEEYIIKTPQALENLTHISQEFQIQEVDFEEKNSGIIQFKDKTTGEELWHFPKPVLYELNDKKEGNYDLSRKITKKDNQYLSKKILGNKALEWLKDPAREYPIVIDETVLADFENPSTNNDYYDGYIEFDGASTYTNYDSETTILFGGSGGDSYRGYIKFDIDDFTGNTYEQVDFYVRSTTAHLADDTYIKSLDADPNGRAANLIWSDIGGATSTYVTTTDFQSAGYEVINLGSTALTDLNNAVSGATGWFGLGFQSSDETNDYAAMAAEEYATAVYRPRLAGIWDTIEDEAYNASLQTARRNTFFDTTNANYWAIFTPTTNTIKGYYSSDDGDTWNADVNTIDGRGANIWWNQASNKVYMAYYNNADIRFIMGSVGANSITWDVSYTTALNGTHFSTDVYTDPAVTVDTDGYCHVAAKHYNQAAAKYYVETTVSDDSDCDSWAAATQHTDTNTTNLRPDIVAINNGDVYLVWNDSTTLKGRRWDGATDSWEGIDTIVAAGGIVDQNSQAPQMVTDGNSDIHLVYKDDGHDITYDKYDESASSWGGVPYEIQGGAVNLHFPSISFDTATNDIYAIYFAQPNYYSRTIYYNKCDTDNDCTNGINWGAQQTLASPVFYLSYTLATSYRENGRVWVIYGEGVYAVSMKSIIIPENLWFLIPIIAILPKQIQKLLKGRKKKKRKKFLKSSSVFVFKKKK